ncbi:nose resistant to fluoxetine protein 6-like [Varroa destructor]|uniref:Uncharacterized protein n=1 Tax=Varroa destructor TaxID=109461 RepID=A0A7M7MCK1_VARDE|nr:nose resistant to fluoxetine protein 6-like [Varroa destructor]
MIAHGSYDECLAIRVPNKEDPSKVDFNAQYCTLGLHIERQPTVRRNLEGFVQADKYLKHYLTNITWVLNLVDRIPLIRRMALCLPSTCSPDIVPHFIEKLLGKYGVSSSILGCRNVLDEKPYPTGTYAAITVTCVLVAIVFAATLVDYLVPLQNKVSAEAVNLVRCFSARAATRRLTTVDREAEHSHLDSIHGIRVLSALWILLSHTYATDPGNLDRPYHLFALLQDPRFTVVTQGIYSVDTFYTLTGILFYRNMTIERKRFQNISVIPFSIVVVFRRAIRLLTPTLGALCLLYLLPAFVTGPSMDYMYNYFTNNCAERWWYIPLFISNLQTLDEACILHSWYMAADLQMICILTLPVLALIAWPRKGIWLIGAIAVTSIIYAGSMLIIYETTPTILFTPLTLSNAILFSIYQHVSSLAHLSTMCIGVLGAYLIEHHRDIKARRSLFVLGWIFCIIITSTIVFFPFKWHFNGNYGFGEGLAYVTLSRPVWAACIVWVLYACAAGYGEPVRTLFNRPNVVILSRLSFCFYLVSSTLVLVKMFAARTATAFTHFQEMRDFCADMVYGYIVGYVLFLLFEGPTYALDKWIVNLCSRKRSVEQNGRSIPICDYNERTKSCKGEVSRTVENSILSYVKSRL